jgi:hypothetical protein
MWRYFSDYLTDRLQPMQSIFLGLVLFVASFVAAIISYIFAEVSAAPAGVFSEAYIFALIAPFVENTAVLVLVVLGRLVFVDFSGFDGGDFEFCARILIASAWLSLHIDASGWASVGLIFLFVVNTQQILLCSRRRWSYAQYVNSVLVHLTSNFIPLIFLTLGVDR